MLPCALVGALCAPAGAWTIERHDCTSVHDYVSSNLGGNLFRFLAGAVPVAHVIDTASPSGDGWAALDYLGVAVSILRVYAQVGLSPMDLANVPLGFVCLRVARGGGDGTPGTSCIPGAGSTPAPASNPDPP